MIMAHTRLKPKSPQHHQVFLTNWASIIPYLRLVNKLSYGTSNP